MAENKLVFDTEVKLEDTWKVNRNLNFTNPMFSGRNSKLQLGIVCGGWLVSLNFSVYQCAHLFCLISGRNMEVDALASKSPILRGTKMLESTFCSF